MLQSNFQKILISTVALALLAVGGVAGSVVHSSIQQADTKFRAVVLIDEIDQQLVRSLTSIIVYMRQTDADRDKFASSARIDLNLFRKAYKEFANGYAVGHSGISDLFGYPVSISMEAQEYISLGDKILGGPESKNMEAEFESMLSIARNKLQEAISIAQQVAQQEYSQLREQMLYQLYFSLAAIAVLLLSGVWMVDRMLAASNAAADAAKSAANAKSEFLSTMSHEIRTPMSGVLGMAELLQRTELTDKQRLYVSTILSSGEALTTIINDVLDLAKINAGKMTVRKHPFDLTTLVEDVATLLSPRSAEKNTEFTVRVQPGLPSGYIGDAGHIRQVLINLAGNAVKFTENGTILLDISGTVKSETAHLKISVQDSGIGIPNHQLSTIFDKFEQASDPDPARLAATEKTKGTGLGLAVSKKLVELMGGSIGAESKVDEGSTFWFTVELPVDANMTSENRMPEEIEGARILVVDDNPINRTVTIEQLSSRSLHAEAVPDAKTALSVLRDSAGTSNEYDLAVLDYHMLGMDGLDLAAAIREDDKISHIPLLMVTSIMNAGDNDAFQATRIDGHLSKPVRLSLMFETIVDVLHRTQRTCLAPSAEAVESQSADPTNDASDLAAAHPRRQGQTTDTRQYPRRHESRPPQQGSGRR